MSGEFGAAVLMYQKAIDLLHTLYCCNDLLIAREIVGVRQPSAADMPITDGFRGSIGATLSLHPDAPVKESIAEVAHRLSDIFFTCKRAGIPSVLYGNALVELEPTARQYGIGIDRSAFDEPKYSVINNQGIIASGNSIVSQNAFAYGQGGHATTGGASPVSGDDISALLRTFISELSRSGHPDRLELAATAEEVHQELEVPAPRLARLKILANGLAAAVKGAGSLAWQSRSNRPYTDFKGSGNRNNDGQESRTVSKAL
jgi:hypothetical protein